MNETGFNEQFEKVKQQLTELSINHEESKKELYDLKERIKLLKEKSYIFYNNQLSVKE
jgi:phosphopantetheine adenylyltransferase